MEIVVSITFLLFATSFFTYFLTAFLMYITRKRLKRRLKKNFPKIWFFDFSFNDFFDYSVVGKAIKLFLCFGSQNGVRQFNSHFFDIAAIEKLNDTKTNIILKRLLLLTSIFAKLWIIILGSLIIIGIAIGIG